MKKIDVIVPVYAGLQATRDCLNSALHSLDPESSELVIIYDCGPDPDVEVFLDQFAEAEGVSLSKNPRNLGFVATVNRGMALHPDRDVVLLNSDTVVANDWLQRLRDCADSDSRIATVTPFSNNAEICSFPGFCQDNTAYEDLDVALIDSVFAGQDAREPIDLPTGVGFCMYIRRRALQEVGVFDEETYGRGYGEENDFCQRALAAGWRNVLCPNVYVYHEGGVSFSSEKSALVERAMQTLDRLYPNYHSDVAAHIAADPARLARVLAEIELIRRSGKTVCLALCHKLGGGTFTHLRELAACTSDSMHTLVLRPETYNGFTLDLSLSGQSATLHFTWPDDRDAFSDLCSALNVQLAHVHHISGMEAYAHELVAVADCSYRVTLHDYYFINGNPTLSDSQGRFVSAMHQRDVQCASHYPVPLGFSADSWREHTGRFLRSAEQVISPSRYVADLYHQYFYDVPILVRYHPDYERDFPYPDVLSQTDSGRHKILVLGALGLEKGADVLDRVSALAQERKMEMSFHLLGYAYRPLNPAVHELGAYEEEKIDELIDALNPTLIWFPCQWPETYSYTLSAALRCGVPVLAPALGSFAERMQGRPLSRTLTMPLSDAQWLAGLEGLLHDVRRLAGQSSPWKQADSQDRFYQSEFAAGFEKTASPMPEVLQQTVSGLLRAEAAEPASANKRESLLRILDRMRRLPVLRPLVRMVPFQWQRRIKRSLSSRPLHDIVDG